ncbi:hybrid sensor histidine kinase/response regulator transcription factor [Flavobacterium sp. UBA6135]|uniref:hybrid sensor histidine kinase/response regulator transcription factor n=1 Tax=Flavobacterium sp. UBA6135 TaxID=1946553 RepID=UPI0025BECB46|nr:two-component regulator propeller domain-containing protein [Flavobacterium sp. UBA6135]
MNLLQNKTLGLLSCFFLFSWVVSAQDVRFQKLTINEGLSQNVVFSITQDSDGFMWFATKDGLNRYDGYTFTIYQHSPSDKNSLASNYITTLFNDRNGTLWIGTENGVLHNYNKKTNNFQRIYLPLAHAMSKNTAEITNITQDKNATIWVGTKSNGIFKIPFDEEHYKLNQITQIYKNPKSNFNLSDNNISKLHVDDSGMLWIATANGLTRMHMKNEAMATFYFEVQHKSTFGLDKDFGIGSIAEADKNKLWLGTRSGLVLFNTLDFSYEFYPHHLNIFRYGWGNIKEIVEDKKGNLWLATAAELMRFDKTTKKYESFKNDPLLPESLNYNSISSLFIDHSNMLWVGTTGMGINYYDPKANRFGKLNRKDFLNSRIPGFSIRSIVEENDRYVWIGAEVLYRWDRKTNQLKTFESSSKNLKHFGNTSVSSLLKSKDNALWIGSTEGLFRYNPKTEETVLFANDPNNPNSLPKKGASFIFESQNGTIWVITENHLSKIIDRNKGIFKNYTIKNNSAENFIVQSFIYEDENNILWIASKNGMMAFNPVKESFHTYLNNPENEKSLSNNNVNVICPDPYHPSRFLWIGTTGGLNLFDKKHQTFTHFSQKDGLPNNVVYGILPDSQNFLWLSTNKGISKFNPKDKTFRNYDVHDGLQSNEFNTGAFYKSAKGELFFGGISGVNYFFPEQIQDNPYLPSVAITGIKIYSENKSKKDYTETREIHSIYEEKLQFSHRDNILIFEFAALDFSAIAKNKFAYQLENFNDNWIYIDKSRSATFTNLPPGNYTFKVKGSNNDGVWNQKVTTVSFQVLPHWSGTWWAYLGYFLILLAVLYRIRNYEMKRLKWKAKIEKDKNENETLRNLDQLKTRFFTNISHEFRTPLTLIRGNIEQLMEDHNASKIKNQLHQIDQNTQQLLKLINQLLDISKLEAGATQLNSKTYNIVPFIEHLVYSLEAVCQNRGITLSFTTESQTIHINYDEEKMEKVILNLLSNALKFTNDNGTIVVSVTTNNNTVYITVKDDGVGIEPTALPFIFNRFYQADNSDTKPFAGTGIGLTLVKELIELHKGKVHVIRNEDSNNDKGTTFIIELPIGIVVDIPLKQPIKKEMIFHDAVPDLKVAAIKNAKEVPKKIIVLVDDNPHIRLFLKQQLKDKYKIIEAENDKKGILKSQKHIPDLIIADIMMPEMDGYTMVEQLRNDELTSHIPIILLTGKATLDDKLKGLEYGVDAYLTKPFNSKELKITMANLMDQREQLRLKFQKSFKVEKSQVAVSSVDQLFLEKTIHYIKDNMDNANFSVELLAQKMCLSPSQLHQKMVALLDQAPGQLIRSIRLEHSADLLIQNAGNIAEICYQTGFSDQTYFSRAFKNQFGCSPSSYKKTVK